MPADCAQRACDATTLLGFKGFECAAIPYPPPVAQVRAVEALTPQQAPDVARSGALVGLGEDAPLVGRAELAPARLRDDLGARREFWHVGARRWWASYAFGLAPLALGLRRPTSGAWGKMLCCHVGLLGHVDSPSAVQ